MYISLPLVLWFICNCNVMIFLKVSTPILAGYYDKSYRQNLPSFSLFRRITPDFALFRRYYMLSFDEIETKSRIVYEKRA